MIFSKHSAFEGQHAFLSPSNYHWVNYDDEKLDRMFVTAMAAKRGTELHELAQNLIRLGVKLPETPKTMNLYVNDSIGFRLTPEQVLFYSENCFGTADAVGFRNNTLRINELKTGVTPASTIQLEIYAALFCLEYKFRPFEIGIELRLYQNDEMEFFNADPDSIFHIMDKIISFEKRIRAMREEALS